MNPTYIYNATVVKVIDGDTIDVSADLGFYVSVRLRLRLIGINAPELSEEAGKVSRDRLRELLPIGAKCTIRTSKDPGDKYGRWLAVIATDAIVSVNDWMIEQGLATKY